MGITELCGLSATLARLTTRCRSGLGTSHMCGSCRLAAVLTGLGAMVARKGRGRHSAFGTLYYRSLLIVCVTMAGLSAVRWAEDYHLFVLGALAFAAAFIGRRAVRRQQIRLHLLGM